MESAESQRLAAVAVGKQPEVADLDETGGQHMEHEAAHELDRIEGQDVYKRQITYHVNVPMAKHVCAAELTVKVGHSEDEIKKIAATVGSSK